MVHAYDPAISLEFIKLSIKYIRRLPRLDNKSIVVIVVLINYLIVIKHFKTIFTTGFIVITIFYFEIFIGFTTFFQQT